MWCRKVQLCPTATFHERFRVLIWKRCFFQKHIVKRESKGCPYAVPHPKCHRVTHRSGPLSPANITTQTPRYFCPYPQKLDFQQNCEALFSFGNILKWGKILLSSQVSLCRWNPRPSSTIYWFAGLVCQDEFVRLAVLKSWQCFCT